MSLLLHQFNKDCRSLRWLLALWGALILLQSLLVGTAGLGSGGWVSLLAYKMLAYLVPLLQMLLIWVLVPLLIYEEPLVGSTAAWLTRPLSRGTLLASKAFFVVAVLVVPPLLTELAVLAANGVPPHDLALAGAEIAFKQCALVAATAALASLTPNFARFVIWSLVAGMGGGLVAFGTMVARLLGDPERLWTLADPERLRAHEVAANTSFLVLGTAVVLHQYLTRRTRRSVAVYVSGFVILFVVQMASLGGGPPPAIVPSGPGTGSIRLSVDPETVYARDEFSLRALRRPRKTIAATSECQGTPPDGFCQIEELRATLTYADGRAVPVERQHRPSFQGVAKSAAEAALGGSVIVNALMASFRLSDLFEVDGASYSERGTMPAQLEGQGTVTLKKYRIAVELPLKPGASRQTGSDQTAITEVLRGPGSCQVVFRERRLNLLFSSGRARPQTFAPGLGDQPVYVLVNRERRQAFLTDLSSMLSNAFAQMLPPQRLSHDAFTLTFSSESESRLESLPALDDAWLQGAALVRLETVDLGRVTAPVSVPSFVIDRSKIERRSEVAQPEVEPGLTAEQYYERGAARLEDVAGRMWTIRSRDETKAYFTKAVEIDPQMCRAYAALALFAALSEDKPQAKRDAAKAWLDKARAIRSADPAYDRVEAFLADAERGDPVAIMERVVRQSPGVAAYWRDLGYFRARSYRLQRALAAFDRALEVSPDAADAARTHAQRGQAYAYSGLDPEAGRAYEAALAQRPDHSPYWTRLCQVRLDAGECRAARDAAAHARDVDDGGAFESCFLRAEICLGTPDETSPSVRSALSWNPWDLLALGDFFRDRGDYAKASSYYDKARHSLLRADDSDLAASLSELALGEGDLGKAWSVLEPALAAHPGDADVLAQAAAVEQRRGAAGRAREWAAQALEARLDRKTLRRLDGVFARDPAYRALRARVTERVDGLFTYYERKYDYQHLRRDDAMAQWMIGHAGATHKDPEAVPHLVRYLAESASAETRAKAADALWTIRDRRAVSALIAALGDPSLKVKGFAASGLGDLRDPAAVPPLLALFEQLEDNREETKARVADALGKLGDHRAAGPIRSSLDTIKEPAYVSWAQGALARLERP